MASTFCGLSENISTGQRRIDILVSSNLFVDSSMYSTESEHVVLSKAIEAISSSYTSLSSRCREDFLNYSRFVRCSKHSTLVKEGDFSRDCWYVISGSIRAYYLKEGKDITDWFSFEGDFINSINSFFQDVPSPHYMETMEESELLVISRDNIWKLCEDYHDFERLGRIAATKTMLQLQQRIVSLQFETAQQKYENLLRVRPDITKRVPLTHIASFLGITLETLSRIRNPRTSHQGK
jgi:CRP-like cAMP-binding protein